MQRGPLVDLWPRMNTRFCTQPTDGCMRVRDGSNAGWKGRGTCSPEQGEPDTGIPEHVRTEIQDAALTALPSQNDRPRQLSTSLTFNSTFSVPSIPDSDRRIHFHGDPERIANGLRIASASAGHSASIHLTLSALRIFLFTFLARHAEPLPLGRIWRTPDPPEVRHKCVTSASLACPPNCRLMCLWTRPLSRHLVRHPVCWRTHPSSCRLPRQVARQLVHRGSAGGRPRHPPWIHHLVHRLFRRLVHRMTRQWLR